jgi:hypothetical protein
LEENLDFLEAVVATGCGIELLPVLDKVIGKGKLVQNYINFMKNQEEANLEAGEEDMNV